MATSLELAIAAIRSGRKEEGRQLLNLLIQQNPNNEMAWLWMSSVVNSDEQRARCLYHVLAINPDNEIARRGLQVLGIVVSDSRPVKVPRDSQPIQIPKPTPPTPPATPPTTERRPFRLDPHAITQELPFTPIREPFADPLRRSPSAFVPRVASDEQAGDPTQAGAAPEATAAAGPQPGVTAPASPNEQGWVPSEPGPAGLADAATEIKPRQTEGEQPGRPDTGPLPNPAYPGAQPHEAAQAGTPPQQPYAGSGLPNETRPSPPIWTSHSNMTMGMPQPVQPNPLQYPAPAAPPFNSNVTMGMPAYYLPAQSPPPGPSVYSNTTMGMPVQMQSGPMPSPAEAIPGVHSNTTMGMVAYPLPFQQPLPQHPAFHSSSTMAMPTPAYADPLALLRAAANQSPMLDERAAQASRSSIGAKKEEKEGEEVNILAVIIFGSLSVTALGGLGMLILLMFTSGG